MSESSASLELNELSSMSQPVYLFSPPTLQFAVTIHNIVGLSQMAIEM